MFFDEPISKWHGIKRRPLKFGVFIWRQDGVYGDCTILRKFATEAGAQAHADRLNANPDAYAKTNGHGYVVRDLPKALHA